MKRGTTRLSALLALGLVLGIGAWQVFTFTAHAAEATPETAPLNPEFTRFQQRGAMGADTETGNAVTGFVPPPYLRQRHQPGGPAAMGPLAATALSAKYDLRDPNGDGSQGDSVLTAVRNQGSCGSCWAFGTYGSLEGHVRQFLGLTEDYSEDNLKNLHGFDWGPCSGGNYDMSAAYLSRHSGPISEGDDPYSQSATSTSCTTCAPVRYVDNGLFLPGRADVSDNLYLKQALVDHGALATYIYYSDSAYNSATRTYYYNDPNDSFNDSNHGVVLVGWDDDKAVPGAPGPGAFIVRNSWGSSWGEGGYFYVSYHDESFAFNGAMAFDEKAESSLDFDKIHYYDELGQTRAFGYSGSGGRYGWGANWFTAEADGSVVAVSFFATEPDLQYEIYVYGDFSGSSFSNLLATRSGTARAAGWVTVPLDTAAPVRAGDGFGVAMRFQLTGGGYPVPMESPVSGYASGATANAGESFYSSNGATWTDLTRSYANTNVCIKALVKNGPSTGGVRANLGPAQAVTDGARWRVDGGAWRASGETASGLAPGQHTVSFLAITGWTTPTDQQVSVAAGETREIGATYTARPVPQVSVTATSAAASEQGAGPGVFTLTRTGPVDQPLVVSFVLAGTARMGKDYETIPLEATIPSGSASADVTITPIDDAIQESTETVILKLARGSGYTLGTSKTAQIDLADNDTPRVTLLQTDVDVSEPGNARNNGELTVRRSGAITRPLTVIYEVGGTATPGADYQALPGSITIPAGQRTASIVLFPLHDTVVEGDETIVVTLLPDAAYLVGGTGGVTITLKDNDF